MAEGGEIVEEGVEAVHMEFELEEPVIFYPTNPNLIQV